MPPGDLYSARVLCFFFSSRRRHTRSDRDWSSDVCSSDLESLVELNELCLGLLAEQAAVRGSQPSLLLRQVGELWRVLDAAARRRAAACPYLLVDAGFADPPRWRQPVALGVGDTRGAASSTFFTVPGATEVARLGFTYAWHLVRAHGAAARLR